MQMVRLDLLEDATHTFRFPGGAVMQVSVLNGQIVTRGIKKNTDYVETRDDELSKVCVERPEECKLVLYTKGSRGFCKQPFGLFDADVEYSVKKIEYEEDD